MFLLKNLFLIKIKSTYHVQHIAFDYEVFIMKNLFLAAITLTMSSLVLAGEATTIHWGYDQEIGAAHWGELSEQYKTCSTGKNQTPINIHHTYRIRDQHPIEINYQAAPKTIIFNGHTVQVNTESERDYLQIEHEKFNLKQFHFHTPSENQINGKNFPLELHFVNQNAQGELTVLAVMFKLGKENSEISKMWADISTEENHPQPLRAQVNLTKLLPTQHGYYRFSGSLTTPPCSEGVTWIVLKQPLTLSEKQLEQFKDVLKQHSNNRPIQPLNGRLIIED